MVDIMQNKILTAPPRTAEIATESSLSNELSWEIRG